jgi:hypothetical protein
MIMFLCWRSRPFNSNALLQDNYRLDSVVCLVDSKHIAIHLDEKKPDGNINEAENQVGKIFRPLSFSFLSFHLSLFLLFL